MKLTKSILKQLIKEALREAHEGVEDPSSDENPEIDALLRDASELYASLPDEGKRLLTQNFEEYFNKWEQELEGESEEDKYHGQEKYEPKHFTDLARSGGFTLPPGYTED